MSIELIGTLGLLALIDSLSIGTLLIPVFFLIAPRLRVGRLLLYLATIAVFYFLVGVALTAGAVQALDVFRDVLETRTARIVQLVVGVGLLVGSFFVGSKKHDPVPTSVEADGRTDAPGIRSPESAGITPRRVGRLSRWRDRALAGSTSPAVIMAIALGAGLVEVATMLPYLGAVGALTAAPLGAGTRVGLLGAYCLVMVLPALVLLTVRLLARSLVEPQLRRLAAWLERTGAETTAWIVGIVGFLVARDAAGVLGLFGSG